MKKNILCVLILLFALSSYTELSRAEWREGGGGDADAAEALSLMKNELMSTLKWSKSKALRKLPISEVQKVIEEIDYSLNKTETSSDDLLVFDENVESSGTPKGCKYQKNEDGAGRILCDRGTWTIWSVLDSDLGKGKKIGTLYKETLGVKGFGESDRYLLGFIVEAEFVKMQKSLAVQGFVRKGSPKLCEGLKSQIETLNIERMNGEEFAVDYEELLSLYKKMSCFNVLKVEEKNSKNRKATCLELWKKRKKTLNVHHLFEDDVLYKQMKGQGSEALSRKLSEATDRFWKALEVIDLKIKKLRCK